MNENKEIDNLRAVAKMMEEFDLKYVKFKSENFDYELEREILSSNPKTEIKDNNKKAEEKIMKSPLVGIFYRRRSPNTKPFVEVGDTVKKGDVVCLVEAMKTFTEVASDFNGKVTEFCIEDGEIIEFSQPILKYIP